MAIRIGEGPDEILSRKSGFQPVGGPFFEDHFILDGKTVSIWEKTFFGGRRGEITLYWTENRLNLIKDQSKSGSRLFDSVSSLQNSPTPSPMQIPGYEPDTIIDIYEKIWSFKIIFFKYF